MSDLILDTVVDLGLSQARYRAWRLLLVPNNPLLFQISAAYLQNSGGTLQAAEPVAFSRTPTVEVPMTVLTDSDENTFARFDGPGSIGIVWQNSAPVFANGAALRTKDGTDFSGGALLQGGKWTGSAFVPEYAQALQIQKGAHAGEVEYRLHEAQAAFLEPMQSDMDFMTPGGVGYLRFRVTTEHFPQPGFPEYKPQYARVQLHRLNDGKVIQTKWSNPVTGEGIFENVDPSYAYAITATHPEHAYQALIASNVRAKVD